MSTNLEVPTSPSTATQDSVLLRIQVVPKLRSSPRPSGSRHSTDRSTNLPKLPTDRTRQSNFSKQHTDRTLDKAPTDRSQACPIYPNECQITGQESLTSGDDTKTSHRTTRKSKGLTIESISSLEMDQPDVQNQTQFVRIQGTDKEIEKIKCSSQGSLRNLLKPEIENFQVSGPRNALASVLPNSPLKPPLSPNPTASNKQPEIRTPRSNFPSLPVTPDGTPVEEKSIAIPKDPDPNPSPKFKMVPHSRSREERLSRMRDASTPTTPDQGPKPVTLTSARIFLQDPKGKFTNLGPRTPPLPAGTIPERGIAPSDHGSVSSQRLTMSPPLGDYDPPKSETGCGYTDGSSDEELDLDEDAIPLNLLKKLDQDISDQDLNSVYAPKQTTSQFVLQRMGTMKMINREAAAVRSSANRMDDELAQEYHERGKDSLVYDAKSWVGTSCTCAARVWPVQPMIAYIVYCTTLVVIGRHAWGSCKGVPKHEDVTADFATQILCEEAGNIWTPGVEWLKIPSDKRMIQMGAFVLGFFLVFRTVRASTRWWEARVEWQDFVSNSVCLVRGLCTQLYRVDVWKCRLVALLVVAFAFVTKQDLRDQGGDYEYYDDMFDNLFEGNVGEGHGEIVQRIVRNWHKADCLQSHIGHRFMDYLTRILSLAEKTNHIHPREHRRLHMHLSEIVKSHGTFIRIHDTALPITYTMHIRLVAIIVTMLLPLLWMGNEMKAPAYDIIPICSLIAFAIFGVEDLAVALEDPFGEDPGDLPLEVYCNKLFDEVRDTLKFFKQMEKLCLAEDDESQEHTNWVPKRSPEYKGGTQVSAADRL